MNIALHQHAHNRPLVIDCPKFKFTDSGACRLLYRVPTCGGYCDVVGDSGFASYEWLLRDDHGDVVDHSDDGYGMIGCAMRDGLIKAEGVPASLSALGVDEAHGDMGCEMARADNAEYERDQSQAEAARLRLQNASLIEQRDRLVQTRTPDNEVDRIRAALDAALIEAQQRDSEIKRLHATINEYESQWVDEHV